MGQVWILDLYVYYLRDGPKSSLRSGWDVSHPSAGQALADLGVDIVFAPTYWIGYDSSP